MRQRRAGTSPPYRDRLKKQNRRGESRSRPPEMKEAETHFVPHPSPTREAFTELSTALSTAMMAVNHIGEMALSPAGRE